MRNVDAFLCRRCGHAMLYHGRDGGKCEGSAASYCQRMCRKKFKQADLVDLFRAVHGHLNKAKACRTKA